MKLTAEFLLTATASDIRDSLERGSITSVELVNTYLDHIDRHNKTGAKCNAVLFPALRFQALAWAAKLDRERANGATRGPLHGIPILIKDSIATGIELGMPTTAGSHALLNSRPPQNSAVVDRLLESGLIILGKANMTEFLGKKGLAGWSALGGMCQPAYIPDGYRIGEKRRGETTPAGSSTGSAVGVACGFSPISLGTETTGSIVSPAAVAALYALKLTPGSVSLKGVFHLTRCLDTIGAMGKSAFDVALTCDVLLPANDQSSLGKAAGSVDLKSLSIGFVDIELWRLPKDTQVQDPEYFSQTAEAYNNAKKTLRDHGVTVKDVYITPPEQYMVDGVNVDDLMDVIINRQSKRGFDDYLKDLQYTDVHTLAEVIKFNERHPDLEFHKGEQGRYS
jgi:amidase